MDQRIKEAFDSVYASDDLKARSLARIEQEREKLEGKERTPSPGRRPGHLAIAFALLLFLAVSSLGLYASPVAALSLDGSPSLELTLNRFDRVVASRAYEAENQALLQELALKNLPLDQALDRILAAQDKLPARDSDQELTIALAAKKPEKEAALSERINRLPSMQEGRGQCMRMSWEDYQHAQKAGLSMGRYRAWAELQGLDPSLSLEEVQAWTMPQFRQAIANRGGQQSPAREGQAQNDKGPQPAHGKQSSPQEPSKQGPGEGSRQGSKGGGA